MDVWGPARISGQGHERYFLLVFDDYTRYTTVFPLRSKGQVLDVLIPWICVVRLQLRERIRANLPVLCLHSDRGGEFCSDLLRDFCRGEGILQSFTLPDSPQQNGIAERRIGLVMEVARTSMIHAAAPHFLWPFAVRYAAHQLNLWPRVSLPETSPTLRWTGKVGDASEFRVWGSRALVRDTSADKLSARAIPCVFLGFVPDVLGWQIYHPTSPRVLPSQDVMFDESVPFYHLFPYRFAPLPPPPLFLAPGPPPVDPLPPQGPAPSGVSQVDPPSDTVSGEVAVESGAARGTAFGGAEPGGAETGGAEPGGADTGGAELGGAETGVAEPAGAESKGVEPGGAESGVRSLGVLSLKVLLHLESGATSAGGAGAARAGGAGATTGAGVPGGTATTGPGGARTRGTGAAGIGGVGGAGAGDPTESGAAGVEALALVALELEELEVEALAREALELEQVLGVPSSTGLTPPLLCPPPIQSQPSLQPASPLPAPSPYTEQTGSLTECHEPASRPASPVRTGRRIPCPRPPRVPGTHAMTLRPSSVPLRVPLPAPLEFSLPEVPDPESDRAHATSPNVSRLLATAVTDPSFESAAASALVAELLDFAAACRLDYSTALVAKYACASPPSVGGECALGTDVLEDRKEDFECLAAAVPRFASMLLAPEGDPDAPDIPTPRSYAEAIMGPYSSKGQAAMDTEMASWKSYCDYELHSLDFSTAFLQGSLHEEIWLRCPPGFTGSFPAGTHWILPRPVYGLRQAPREWHDTLRTTLAALGFAPSTADPSLFLRTNTSLSPFYVLVYIGLRYFLARELQQCGQLRLAYVATRANTTDIFTKALSRGDAQRFSTVLGLLALLFLTGLVTCSPPLCPWGGGKGGGGTPLKEGRARSAMSGTYSDYTCLNCKEVLRAKPRAAKCCVKMLCSIYCVGYSGVAYKGSFELLRDSYHGEGILQSFTLPASPQQIGIAERRIGLVMEVACSSMIHAAAPHFLLPFAVWYAAHQLNLWPRVSVLESSPTLCWTRQVGDASVFRVWGSRAFVRDTSADKLSARAIHCVFLGFPPDVPGWQFYRPTSRRVFPSQDVTFDKLVDPLPGTVPVEVSGDSGTARATASGGAQSGGVEPGGAESQGAVSGGAEPGGAEPGGAEPAGVEPGGAELEGTESGGAEPRGDTGDTGAGCAGVTAGAGGTGGTAAAGPGGARTRGTGASGTGGVWGAGAEEPMEPGAPGAGGNGAGGAGAGALAREALELEELELEALAQEALELDDLELLTLELEVLALGVLVVLALKAYEAATPASPLPSPSPYTEQSSGLTEHREPVSCPVSPVRTAHRVPHSRPPPVPGTHAMALPPSSVPLRVPLPPPPESSLPTVPDPESDLVFDLSFDSTVASALVAELLDFAAAFRLDNATSLVAESESASPPSVGGECALGTDVLEDKQEDFECLAAAVPRFSSMLLALEGDPDAPDIPTPRSFAEAITAPVPGSPPAFKARYIARGFTRRQGVDYFQNFSPTPEMTTVRVLLHVAAQRDYELHSLYFTTAFLQGSLHEEIWLRRPSGFIGSFPAGTQWSLRRPVYSLRQAPREWYDTLRTTLAAFGFAPYTADSSLFLHTDTSLPPFYVLVYVDDLFFATTDTEALTIVLQRFGFQFSSPQSTPLSTGHLLSAPPSDDSIEPSGLYLDLVGCLIYLMTCTRPDLAYPLSLLARYVAPVRHRKGPVVLTSHADASWVDDSAMQRTSQGYTFSLGSGSVSLRSTCSSLVLSSSCEAEIYAGAMAAQELC
ncbi:unnamed protein product [Closterium sp. NIES-53]